MSQPREILFEVTREGKVTAEAEGFIGSSCTQALAAFEVLRGKDTKVQDKSELYEVDQQSLEGTC